MRVHPRTLLRTQPGIEEVNPAYHRQHQSDRGIGDFFRAVVRYVCNRDATFSRESIIHVIESNSATNNQFAPGQAGDGLLCERQIVIQHDRIGVLDGAHQCILMQRITRLDAREVSHDIFFGCQ